jgi:hypothetical protein
MAWAVFEDLALDAQVDERGVVVAGSSARHVAANLDIQPGTAARALRRLRDEGLVVLVRESGTDGRFGLSAYELAEIDGVTIAASGRPCVARPHLVGPPTVEPNPDVPHAATAHAIGPMASASAQAAVDAEGTSPFVAPSPAKPECSPSGSRPAARTKPVVAAQPSLWDEA